MDPITRASKVFLKEAAAHWKARRGHVLFMETEPWSRGDLVKTLRLAEWDPACRRPLFLFEEPCSETDSYFAALSVKLVHDYTDLRHGAAEEGIQLPELEEPPGLGDRGAPAHALAGLRARQIVQALDGGLEGIDIAVVPKQMPAPQVFREAVAALVGELCRSGARLWVFAPPAGPLSDMAAGRTAHFWVDPDELADYLKRLGSTESEGPAVTPPHAGAAQEPSADDAPGRELPTAEASKRLRGLLLDAARASRRGDHGDAARLFGQARTWCQSQGRTVEEVAVLVAMAGAYLAAGAGDLAAGSYQHAFTLAAKSGAHPLAAQAALGDGAVRMQQKRYADAVAAYAAAGAAAERGQVPMLHEEARRMEGTAALAAGQHGEALRASRRAVEIRAQMDGPAHNASTWVEVSPSVPAPPVGPQAPVGTIDVDLAQLLAAAVPFDPAAPAGAMPVPSRSSDRAVSTGTSDIDVAEVLRRPLPFGGGASIPAHDQPPVSPAAPATSATMEIQIAALFKAAMPFRSGAAAMPATAELPGAPPPQAPPAPSPLGKK